GAGSGRPRPDAQRPAGVDPRDRAAAGPDRVQLDPGDADRLVVDHDLARPEELAVLDEADVERGAAHVDRDHVGLAELLAELEAGGRRGGGPGAAQPERPAQGPGGGRAAAGAWRGWPKPRLI